MQSLDLHHLRLLINLIGAVAALIASGFWFRVTATKVLDDKEKEAVLDQLRCTGIWNAWAADLNQLTADDFRKNSGNFERYSRRSAAPGRDHPPRPEPFVHDRNVWSRS
jgi:hypothetical protein